MDTKVRKHQETFLITAAYFEHFVGENQTKSLLRYHFFGIEFSQTVDSNSRKHAKVKDFVERSKTHLRSFPFFGILWG